MKFEKCATCVKHIRGSEIDKHMCIFCDGCNYEKSITRSVGPKKVYITTTGFRNGKTAQEIMDYIMRENKYVSIQHTHFGIPEIKNVIFNDPATIVFWSDGTKTVVKCQEGDIYDPEKGLAMAISKKVLGNKHDYYHTFKHWLKKCPDVESQYPNVTLKIDAFQEAKDTIRRLNHALFEGSKRMRRLSEEEGK